jgi:hypothetical protein
MFQTCVHDQKIQRKETSVTFLKLFLNVGTSKYKIFLISLKFQSLYKLINLSTKKF